MTNIHKNIIKKNLVLSYNFLYYFKHFFYVHILLQDAYNNDTDEKLYFYVYSSYTNIYKYIRKSNILKISIIVSKLNHFLLDAELDNFIGQEPANIQFQSPSKTQENFPSDTSFQSKENKDTVNQSAKSGYFTTILSSLPNLSLSSVKNDALGSQINQTIDNTSSGVIHEPNPYISPQGQHGSQSEIPGLLAINSQNPQSTNLSGFAAFGPTDTVSNPPQPAAPPNLPQPGYGECLQLTRKIMFMLLL